MKYSDEWWVEVALLNKTFPFKMAEFEDEKICLLKEILKNVSKQKTS
jgi:hypothetical protein